MWNLTSFFSRSTTQQGAAQGEPDETVANNADTSISDADSNPDSSQRTPKASATHTAVPVPELNLQETESTPKKHNQNVSTTTTSMAPPPPPPPPPPPHLRASDTQGQSKLNPSQQQRPPTLKPLSNREFLAPPKPKSSSLLRPTPPSAAATLRTPAALAATSSTLAPGQRPSRKVILGPGHSPLDWAALTKDPRKNLRGANLPPTLIKVTPSMLKIQNGRKGHDAWTSYNGKVYNITPYVSFHPGGKGELLRGAGKDSGKLFLETHPWVNWDGILGECLVGILVSENDKSDQTNELDAMD